MRTALFLSVCALLAFGCDGKSSGDAEQDHGHDQEGHSHEHGGHEHDAPHDGTLVVFGSETAHLEFVLDATTGQLEAWVLDGSAENGVRVSQESIELLVTVDGKSETIKLAARANKLSGEKPGDTSEFEATSALLKGVTKFDATVVSLTVKGTEFKSVEFPFPAGNE